MKEHSPKKPTAGAKPAGDAPVRVGLISLGCAKNLVDAEIMLGSLLKSGVEITNDAAQADVVIVNTCSFIDSAQEESVDTILESAEVREANNRGQGLIVSGCLPQRFRDELPKLLPEVDAFMGIDQVAQVSDIVKEALERRAQKVQSPKPKVQSRKTKVVARLGELDKGHAPDAHEKSEAIRGTDKFGNTKTTITEHGTRHPLLSPEPVAHGTRRVDLHAARAEVFGLPDCEALFCVSE